MKRRLVLGHIRASSLGLVELQLNMPNARCSKLGEYDTRLSTFVFFPKDARGFLNQVDVYTVLGWPSDVLLFLANLDLRGHERNFKRWMRIASSPDVRGLARRWDVCSSSVWSWSALCVGCRVLVRLWVRSLIELSVTYRPEVYLLPHRCEDGPWWWQFTRSYFRISFIGLVSFWACACDFCWSSWSACMRIRCRLVHFMR